MKGQERSISGCRSRKRVKTLTMGLVDDVTGTIGSSSSETLVKAKEDGVQAKNKEHTSSFGHE